MQVGEALSLLAKAKILSAPLLAEKEDTLEVAGWLDLSTFLHSLLNRKCTVLEWGGRTKAQRQR